MILAVNIGNTNIAFGFYDEGFRTVKLYNTKDYLASGDLERLIRDTLKKSMMPLMSITGAIVSSVVPVLALPISEGIYKVSGRKPIIVDKNTRFGFDFSAYDGKLLGTDRLCGCAAALHKYSPPITIFDLGTATTVNVIDKSGAFVGGAILPGVRMGLNALSEYTSLLPECVLDTAPALLGRDTMGCLSSGAIYGAAAIIDGMSKRIEQELKSKPSIITTGGNASFVIPFCETKNFYEPNLVLEGLVILYERMVESYEGKDD